MESITGFLSPLGLNTSSIRDTLKLVVIGGTVETARRASMLAWNGFVDSFYLTAHFSQEDYPYDWLMHWLSKQPGWIRSREFDVTTCPVSRGLSGRSTGGALGNEDMHEEGERALEYGRCKQKVSFKPSAGTTHTVFYRGHWLKITSARSLPGFGDCSFLKISVIGHNNDILKRLVLEAKREYEKEVEHRVHIFTADTVHACWGWNGTRSKRPMSSIVLDPAIKENLLADCQDFLRSKDWYAERGIRFRRGYLLHGVPRSGKTSLINSLAGELGLDIRVLMLSSQGMCDNTLMKLIKNIPSRCILLLKDLDAVFACGTRLTDDPTSPTEAVAGGNGGSNVTLSGLLAALDWIDSAEGLLLFFTANHVERLDPALSRPGRMDVWVNFTHATKSQAEHFFKHVFQPRPSASSPNEALSIDAPLENPLSLSASGVSASHADSRTAEIDELAQRFADAIPEGELSVASLEGYLLKNKSRPRECVEEVAEWAEQGGNALALN